MKTILDRLVTILAAIATPVDAALVDQHVISGQTAIDIGAVVAALVTAWHGGSVAQAKLGSNNADHDTGPGTPVTPLPDSGTGNRTA